MRISDIRATVTVPLDAPLRHANGCHWGRFVRTIIEVETDEGITGLGEMGGGGESAEAGFNAMKSYLVGHDPARLEEMRLRISNPTASLYNNRTQMVAALEFACSGHSGAGVGRAGVRYVRRPPADRSSVRLVLLLSLSQSASGLVARFAR